MWDLGSGEAASPGEPGRREIAFELGETRVFELPILLFERRHFYRSELS
jgi:hypothetical protein